MSFRHFTFNYVMSVFLVLISQSCVVSHAQTQDELVSGLIRTKVEQFRDSGNLIIGKAQISSIRVLPPLYTRRNFRPIWADGEKSEQLMIAVRDTLREGLDPRDYHLEEIERLRARTRISDSEDTSLLASLDILLTDSLIRLAYHSIFGKEDPSSHHPHWNLTDPIDDMNPVAFMEKAVTSESLPEVIDSWKPQHPVYGRLKLALAMYRAIQAEGGWRPVPADLPLKAGLSDERVLSLRRRLSATGDLSGEFDDSMFFDENLEQAVIHFQSRHRLHTDGVVGKKTFEALNVPIEERIDQIRANLERARWLLHDIRDSFVIVDIAGFHAGLNQEGKMVWTVRAQVGKPYRNTPVFKSAIRYLEFNPTWTIPPGILSKDILPAVKRDPDYLKKRNINVIDRDGKVIEQSLIDWSQYPGRHFPYILRQEPGPDNALGQVKFIFPNEHFVYLHDTPRKSLFDRSERTFSSGCIRVEKPLELAELLLNNPKEWNAAKIKEIINSKQTAKIFLPEPMPVLLLYWTVAVDEDGTVHFKQDPYGRDKAIVEGLKGSFRIRSSHGQ